MIKKALLAILVIYVVYFVVQQPEGAARAAHGIGSAAANSADSINTFLLSVIPDPPPQHDRPPGHDQSLTDEEKKANET